MRAATTLARPLLGPAFTWGARATRYFKSSALNDRQLLDTI